MTSQLTNVFSALPAGLRNDLLQAYKEIVDNYRERRWEPSELNGGKLCEAVFTIVDGFLNNGVYLPRAKKPSNFPAACLSLESKYQQVPDSRSPRILIPRVMLGLYDIRNNRGVGHAGGDVDPNHMDATVVLYMSKWLVAELVRVLHAVTTEEASDVVENLIEREIAFVWSHQDKKRILRLGLTWKQQTLLLLLSEVGDVSEADLVRWLEHPSIAAFRRDVLRPLHRARQVEYDVSTRLVRLLPPGVEIAESLVAK